MAVEAPNTGANPGVLPQISAALRNAARKTGTSFEYLLTTARIESGLKPSAKAATSSAHGLFQFIEQTWLGTLKDHGAAYGYAPQANAIVQSDSGRYEVPDPAARDAIMRLRSDPAASAAMAGAFTRNNTAQLTNVLGRRPSEGELYIAHFLGPDGASRLIDAARRTPNARAADLFPTAASANPSIFTDRSGRALSARQVYDKLSNRFEVARTVDDAPLRGSVPVPAAATRVQQAVAPDTARMTQAFVDANVRAAQVSVDNKPLFQAMFTTREQPIAPIVASLWSDRDVQGPMKPSAADAARPDMKRLFSDAGN